ncbi:MAG: hypothetical protein ACTHXI_02755, partial [Halomonadaceae bacterium]
RDFVTGIIGRTVTLRYGSRQQITFFFNFYVALLHFAERYVLNVEWISILRWQGAPANTGLWWHNDYRGHPGPRVRGANVIYRHSERLL